jgi:hypothetical protein
MTLLGSAQRPRLARHRPAFHLCRPGPQGLRLEEACRRHHPAGSHAGRASAARGCAGRSFLVRDFTCRCSTAAWIGDAPCPARATHSLRHGSASHLSSRTPPLDDPPALSPRQIRARRMGVQAISDAAVPDEAIHHRQTGVSGRRADLAHGERRYRVTAALPHGIASRCRGRIIVRAVRPTACVEGRSAPRRAAPAGRRTASALGDPSPDRLPGVLCPALF